MPIFARFFTTSNLSTHEEEISQVVKMLHAESSTCKFRISSRAARLRRWWAVFIPRQRGASGAIKKTSANLYMSLCKIGERSIPIHPGALVAPFFTSSTNADAVG
jgi:hypothetical protein